MCIQNPRENLSSLITNFVLSMRHSSISIVGELISFSNNEQSNVKSNFIRRAIISLHISVGIPAFSKSSFLSILEYMFLDGFAINTTSTADMYQMEGLKFCCISELESCLRVSIINSKYQKRLKMMS